MSAMIRFRQHLVGSLLFGGTLLIGGLSAQPDVPPPTMDQEGTEAAWDLTHPGWRQWRNQRDDTETSTPPATSGQTNQAEVQALKRKQEEQQKQLEEARRKQQEEARRRRELEQYWQQVQAQQRQQQAQQQQQEAERQRLFEQAKQALLVNFRVPSIPALALSRPLMDSNIAVTWSPYGRASFGQAPTAAQDPQAGLSAQEWQQARQYQGLIRTLRQSTKVPPEDEAILAQVEVRRNALWAKAVSVPGLPDDAREALALTLPVTQAEGPVPRITQVEIQRLEAATKELKEASEKVLWSLLDGINDRAADNLPESAVVENTVKLFGHLLTVAKITMTVAKDGASSAVSESVDFAIGTLPFPQAKIAVGGGRIYANVTYETMNRFMTEVAKVTGVKPDLDAFWRDAKEDLTVGQKASMEFINYGSKK